MIVSWVMVIATQELFPAALVVQTQECSGIFWPEPCYLNISPSLGKTTASLFSDFQPDIRHLPVSWRKGGGKRCCKGLFHATLHTRGSRIKLEGKIYLMSSSMGTLQCARRYWNYYKYTWPDRLQTEHNCPWQHKWQVNWGRWLPPTLPASPAAHQPGQPRRELSHHLQAWLCARTLPARFTSLRMSVPRGATTNLWLPVSWVLSSHPSCFSNYIKHAKFSCSCSGCLLKDSPFN